MSKDDVIKTEGVVVEVMQGAQFSVKLSNGHTVRSYLSGKLRQNRIKVCEGDTVTIEMSPYDLTNGRIVWRNK